MKIGQTLNVIASGEGKSIFWNKRMNERIKELCIQSGAWEHYEINEGVDGDELPMQRFAELIVRECQDNLAWHGHDEAVSQLDWFLHHKIRS
jgi:hypothetical protein